jgi:hypothetical protein
MAQTFSGARMSSSTGHCAINQPHPWSQCPDPSRAEPSRDLDYLVWCDTWINRMKGQLSYTEFIDLCRTISSVMLRTGACGEAAKTTKGYARPGAPTMTQESPRL